MHHRRGHHRVPRHARYVSARTLSPPRRRRGVGSRQGGGDGDVPPSPPPPPPMSQICPRSVRWKPVLELARRATSACAAPGEDAVGARPSPGGSSCRCRLHRTVGTTDASRARAAIAVSVGHRAPDVGGHDGLGRGAGRAARPPGASPVADPRSPSDAPSTTVSLESAAVVIKIDEFLTAVRSNFINRGEDIEPPDSYGRRCATQLRPPESFDELARGRRPLRALGFEAVVGFVFAYSLFVMTVLAAIILALHGSAAVVVLGYSLFVRTVLEELGDLGAFTRPAERAKERLR